MTELAEQAVLGGMMLSSTAITDVLDVLKADDFFKPAHSRIFEAISSQFSAGEPTDSVAVCNALDRCGLLRNVGGAPYLLDLIQQVPTATNAGYYARLVKGKAKLRKLAECGVRLQQLGNEGDVDDIDAVLAFAESMFRELGEPAKSGLMWSDLVNRWQNWQEIKGDVVPSPWYELNQRLPGGGFHPGQLVIVGGRPAQGKSNAGLNVALHAAEQGSMATVFSVEMDAVEVCSRLLAAGTYSEVRQLFSKKLDAKTQGKIDAYIQQSKTLPLEVVDQPYIRVEQIVNHCRVRRPKIIFVDYTQLVAPTDSKINREQQVAHVLRSLKVAAKQLQMVVIAASQLKRRDERDDKYEPKLSDLRESGAAEQDADIVLLLDRAPNAANMKVLVAKNRNGSTGYFLVKFRGDLARLI
jgi:replicative DNA helicase